MKTLNGWLITEEGHQVYPCTILDIDFVENTASVVCKKQLYEIHRYNLFLKRDLAVTEAKLMREL
jgi:hypothetical protein